MPRISPLAKAASTLAACAENSLDAQNSSGLSKRLVYSGFGEGVCTCARCMRRAGPIREDVENKLVQITYALANVYDDSPDLEVRVTDDHRARAEMMMTSVESGDVTQLKEAFLEIEEQEAEGLLEGGTATEIATYLIISAAQVGQPEVIRLLAEWDADMEETDSIRRGRPLMHAANNGHTAAVKALVECGADPEATDDNGYTALMVAVFSDRSSAAEALVEGGASVDTADRAGRTALSYAAMYGSTDCIYLLAGRGGDVAHIDHDGNTPLELAEGSGRQSAVDALKKLQLRVKMQEKRKVKQNKCRSGCSDLDAAQLQAKEQEAARAAAELLEQLEKEEAARTAKAAKKKKKGKSKTHSHDCQASENSDGHQQESAAELLSAAADEEGQQHAAAAAAAATPAASSNGISSHKHQNGAASWRGQGASSQHSRGSLDLTDEEGSGSKPGDGKPGHPWKQPKQAPAASPRGSGSRLQQPQQASSCSSAQTVEEQHGSSEMVTSGDAASPPASTSDIAAAAEAADELELLRRDWEALLEQAARCKAPRQQPAMLARVSDMLQRCVESGISVKYGRKVLQRLQAVGPARSALQAALAQPAVLLDELEAALGSAKSCRCLLEDDLLQHAEEMLAVLQKEHQAQQLRLQQQQLELQRQQQEHERQQQEAAAKLLAQQQAAASHAALPRPGDVSMQHQQQHSADTSQQSPRASQQPPSPPPNSLQAQLQQALKHHQRQSQLQQQQQAAQRQDRAETQSPALQAAAQQHHPQQEPPPGFAPAVQQPQPQVPVTSMPALQQQHLRAGQQQQQDRQVLPSQLQMLVERQQQAALAAGAVAQPLLAAAQQQQQPALSQLQLLQQQQLFASQLQGRQLQGRSGSGMLLSPSAVGTPPLLGTSNSLLQHQLLTPVSQAPGRLSAAQQQQQQLTGYASWPRANLVGSGGFGSVGRPVVGGSGGMQGLADLLAPQQQLLPGGVGLAAAAGELVRRNSLSTPVAVAAPLLLSGQGEMDAIDDHQHPAYAMAHAVLSDDERLLDNGGW